MKNYLNKYQTSVTCTCTHAVIKKVEMGNLVVSSSQLWITGELTIMPKYI